MSSKTRRPKALDPGERAVRWIGNLTLTDDYAGQPFHLRPWQKDIVRKIFGTLRDDGLRQYRKVLLMLPRKQAKTQLSAAIGTYCLIGEGKSGQQIVCAASDKEQAGNLFDKVVSMIEADRELSKRVKIYSSTRKIVALKSGNILKVLSADGRRQHGLNPSVLLFDELHTQQNRELYDALTSAQSTRKESLQFLISTAGERRDSLCFEEYSYAKKVLAKPDLNRSYLPILYEAGAEDDWTSEDVWRKAMPALGDFCLLDFFRDELAKALESPAEEAKFRRLYLNQWVASNSKWLNRLGWDRCGQVAYSLEDLLGKECYGGLDLSSTTDITAFVLVFPWDNQTFRVLCHFWIPRIEAENRDRKDGSRKFRNWARKGWITLTDGDRIDYDLVREEISDLSKEFDLQMIYADPWNSTQIAGQLIAADVPVELVRQGLATMNEPTKFLDVLISRDRMHHGNNPVLNWMADNAVVETDGYGSVKLSKGHSADKIDGMVSLVMGLSASMQQGTTDKPSYVKIRQAETP